MPDTSANNKRIVKNTLFLYVRMIVNLAISLYTSRAILETLGVEDYGIYNVVAGFVSMVSLFTNSVTSATTRFITVSLGIGDLKKMKETYSTLLMIVAAISVLIFIFGELFGLLFLDNYLVIPTHRMASAHIVFHCSILVFIINFLSVPNTALVTAHEKMNFFAFISIGQSFSKLMIVYCLYMTTYDRLVVYAVLLVGVDILVRVLYGWYCNRHFPEAIFQRTFKKSIFKKIFSYSIWASVGSGAAVLKEQGVNILINMFFGVTLNASRGISMQIYHVVDQFSRNIGMAISPQIMKSFAAGHKHRAEKLTLILGKAQSTLLLVLSMPIFLETDYILHLWLGQVPDYAVLFTKWVLILCLARTIENTHTPIFLANGKIKTLELLAGGTMLLNLPICYIFLQMGYEPIITMIIGTIIELICTVMIFVYLKYQIGFPAHTFFKEVAFPVAFIAIIAAILTMQFQTCWASESFWRFLAASSVAISIILSLSFLIMLSKDERIFVLQLARKRLHIKN